MVIYVWLLVKDKTASLIWSKSWVLLWSGIGWGHAWLSGNCIFQLLLWKGQLDTRETRLSSSFPSIISFTNNSSVKFLEDLRPESRYCTRFGKIKGFNSCLQGVYSFLRSIWGQLMGVNLVLGKRGMDETEVILAVKGRNEDNSPNHPIK